VYRAITAPPPWEYSRRKPRLVAVEMHSSPRSLDSGSSTIPSQAAPLAYPSADLKSVLADTSCEYKTVERPERRGQGAELPGDSVDKQIDGFFSTSVLGTEQLAHIAAERRYTEESAVVIKEILNASGIHAALEQEIKDHTGVERTTARAHRQTIGRGEAHHGIGALPAKHGAEAGPGAEMGNDNAPACDVRRSLSQCRRDVIVREPVESIAPDSSFVQLARQSEALSDRWLAMVEGGIKARDLWQRSRNGGDGTNGREIVRLMKGGRADTAAEACPTPPRRCALAPKKRYLHGQPDARRRRAFGRRDASPSSRSNIQIGPRGSYHAATAFQQ
jgi:hypothetical protein